VIARLLIATFCVGASITVFFAALAYLLF